MPPDPDFSATARRPSAAIDDVARRLGIAGFWRWWGAELAPLVPAGTRTALRRRRARTVLAFEADRATLWEPVIRDGAVSMVETASVPLTGDSAAVVAAGRAALAGLSRGVRGSPGRAPRIAVALPARQVLRRTLVLPAAVEENLRQALTYDIDRHTPFKADELYFDAAVVGRDPARAEIRVDLAAARRAVVDQALRHAESFGADVVAVVPDPPGANALSRLNLIPEADRASEAPWRRWQFWVPITLLVVVTIAAVVLPLWQKRAYAIALTRATDDARQQAAVSERLRGDLERLAGDYNFALERKYLFPPTVDVLNEVTKLLPDDTWLLQMEVKNVPRAKEPQRELLLRGESANAGRLISAFEESKVFTQAAPRSPTTKIQPGPGEIFDLAAQLRPLTPPSAQPISADAATRAETPTAAQPGVATQAANPGTPPGAPGAPASTSPAAAAPASAPPAPASAAPAPASTPPAPSTPPGAAPEKPVAPGGQPTKPPAPSAGIAGSPPAPAAAPGSAAGAHGSPPAAPAAGPGGAK